LKRWVVAAALALSLSGTVVAQEREEGTPEMPGWMWINFAILVGGLGYLAAKSVPALLRARNAEILQGIDEAARKKQEAEARSAEIDRRITGLGAEIERLRETVLNEMSAEAERLRQETERQVRRIEEQAGQEIGFITKAASQQLRAYSAELALDLAEQRIQGLMNRQTQHELVDNFVTGLSGMLAEQHR
jgi:F-type H+-transporting ATPase subunit b